MTILEMLEEVAKLPSGDYAECGVYRGASAQVIYENKAHDAKLFLFDSFEGHAEPTEFDNAKAHPKGAYRDTSVAVARAMCPDAEVCPGFIPGRFPEVGDRKFRFVNVDVDHYQPTRDSIAFFLPRLVPGGIMRFDDLVDPDGCPGAVKAVYEFFRPEQVASHDWYYRNA